MTRDPRWLGIMIAPAAWTLQEGLSYFATAQMCGLRAFGPGAARIAVGIITLATASAASWSALQGWRAWRTSNLDLHAAEGRTTADFLALTSLTLGVLLTIGILYGGLPALFVDACAHAR